MLYSLIACSHFNVVPIATYVPTWLLGGWLYQNTIFCSNLDRNKNAYMVNREREIGNVVLNHQPELKGILAKKIFVPDHKDHKLVFVWNCVCDLKSINLCLFWMLCVYFRISNLEFQISRALPCSFLQSLMGNYDNARLHVSKIECVVNLKKYF